jgi:hypothetical protein
MKHAELKESYAVEKYVRRKNSVYAKWRQGFTYPALDSICTELMVRFGALPRWEEYVDAHRNADWYMHDQIEKEHMHWKNQVRDWALERGAVTFRNQTAQLLKFYYAWYRWQYEARHGVITRTYARQMG